MARNSYRKTEILAYHLSNRFADTAIGHLDMQEGGDGGRYVGHVDPLVGMAFFDPPAHE